MCIRDSYIFCVLQCLIYLENDECYICNISCMLILDFSRLNFSRFSFGSNTLSHVTGSAIGFRLDSLLKLADTRATNKMTLMHYFCKVKMLCFHLYHSVACRSYRLAVRYVFNFFLLWKIFSVFSIWLCFGLFETLVRYS